MPLFLIPMVAIPTYVYIAHRVGKAERLAKRFVETAEGTVVTLDRDEWSVV